MVIRKATDKDAKRISYLITKVTDVNPNNYTDSQILAWKKYNTPARIKKRLQLRTVFCAFNNKKLIGTIALQDNYIVGFNVSSSIRKKGIGTILLKHIEAFAKEQGLKQLQLTSTPSALGFYKKYNYKPLIHVVLTIFEVDFPEVEMEKTL